MSNRRTPNGIPALGKGETFDRMHDGAVVIDPDQCALALFITMDGEMHAKTRLTPQGVVDAVEQILTMAKARVELADK